MNKKRKNKDVNEEINEVQENEVENTEENPNLGFIEEIENLKKEVEMWKDKAYRLVADTDNLRKSYEKDHQLMIKYRGQPFVEKLLPTLDSFYLVLKNEPDNALLKNYLIGFNMIYKSMLESLSSEGVSQILPEIGNEFDYNIMQAVEVVEGEKDNIVVGITKPGYMLRDRLVRPAMVVVSKIKELKEENIEKGE